MKRARQDMMKAVLQDEATGVDSLYVGETDRPIPKEKELLIKVCCTALNQMDISQSKGLVPVPPGASTIIGVEVAGIVEQLGAGCSDKFKVGDKVLALISGGGYAEYATAHEGSTMKAPNDTLTMQTLASIPEQWITAYQLLFFVAKLEPGESVLLHAASSGVGQAAIQLATARGIKVFATCRDDGKAQHCLSLGATAAFNIKEHADDFSSIVKEANGGKGVNVILDPVGGSYASENIETLLMDGRWVLYATMGGQAVHDDKFLRRMMAKRISLLPSTLRGRDNGYKTRLTAEVEKEVLPKVVSGQYLVIVDSSYPMTTDGIQQAHRRMASFQNIGKIVVNVNGV